ncbi:hypothetical protein EDB85DRAFT_1979926 [Lactarius pseudohatsudake]|nr:hypothetical protein EDB85DRAFT_1979926 [Lactarius pseudohatsudake]
MSDSYFGNPSIVLCLSSSLQRVLSHSLAYATCGFSRLFYCQHRNIFPKAIKKAIGSRLRVPYSFFQASYAVVSRVPVGFPRPSAHVLSALSAVRSSGWPGASSATPLFFGPGTKESAHAYPLPGALSESSFALRKTPRWDRGLGTRNRLALPPEPSQQASRPPPIRGCLLLEKSNLKRGRRRQLIGAEVTSDCAGLGFIVTRLVLRSLTLLDRVI